MRLRWLEKKRKPDGDSQSAAVQLRESGQHPFRMLDGYAPLNEGELRLYRAIREAVPIVDAAVLKLVRLCGGVRVRCREQAAQAGLEEFLRRVDTGRGQRGIQSFLDGYLDSMLTCSGGAHSTARMSRPSGESTISPTPRPQVSILSR